MFSPRIERETVSLFDSFVLTNPNRRHVPIKGNVT